MAGTDRGSRGEPDGTSALYPFLAAQERDAPALLAQLAASAAAKSTESARLRSATLERCGAMLDRVAHEMATRFGDGGRLFVFGNGGSATDAESIAGLFRFPPQGAPLPARSLVSSRAVMSALGNDVGFDLVFSRQIIAHGRRGDMALGVSTSGSSANLLRAFDEARRRGLVTVGLAGYGGGQMASSPDVDHCLVVASDSVHRIQETQGALAYSLWSRIQALLDDRSAPSPGGHAMTRRTR